MTVASYTEIFLLNRWAPELFSKVGKVSVIFVFAVWALIAAYGVSQVAIDFNFDMFITDKNMLIYKYREAKKLFYEGDGGWISIYSNNTEINYYSEESQLRMYELDEAISRCRDCSKDWVVPDSLSSWNRAFRAWLDDGSCIFQLQGIDPFAKVIDEGLFATCLDIWLKQDSIGRTYKEDLKVSADDSRLIGYKTKVKARELNGLSSEGIPLMLDLRSIEQQYGLNETYSYFNRYMEIEQYNIFLDE